MTNEIDRMAMRTQEAAESYALRGSIDGRLRVIREALREARVQGMREGLSITKGHVYAYAVGGEVASRDIEIEYEDADEAVDAAIEAVRKGER